MKFFYWLKPGIRIKRWISLGICGILCFSFGMSIIVQDIINSDYSDITIAILLIISGSIVIFFAIKFAINLILHVISESGSKISIGSDALRNLLLEKGILTKGPKIVAIGGGTGLSTMLRGLKEYSSNITAIVTVSDDGGGSGVLRDDLGILPPGDIRNCVLALANTEPIMEKLLQYRFCDGMLKGQSFGNLFLAAMNGISDNFEEAVRKMSDVLAVRGSVLPVTLENVSLYATLNDGTIIYGESKITRYCNKNRAKIERVFLQPKNIKPLKEAIDAISDADVIILGPGSLYTSIIPNLLVDDIAKTIKYAKATKVYVCNVMTQPGETEGFTVSNHIKEIEAHSCRNLIDYCIINTGDIPEDLKEKYIKEYSEVVKPDLDSIIGKGIRVITGEFVKIHNNYIRHDTKKLAETIMNIILDEVISS